MTRLRIALLGLLAAAALAQPLRAQDYPRLVIEGRGGASLPLGAFRSGPDTGGKMAGAAEFGLHFVYRGLNGWGAKLGFSQDRFDCTADGCPSGEYVLTSWDIGAQRTFGQNGPVWLRAGLLFGRMERDVFVPTFAPPTMTSAIVSELSVGAEGGAGFRIPVRGRLALTPGARYGWLNTKFANRPVVQLRWLAADLGVALGF